ncbi:MAG: diguanylate cyclase [Bdellovibrionaceae bacterium]|nr:diguanylate cyclase [Pseudobdellovibrionaceae bacterium]
MKINQYRPSFTVFVIDGQLARGEEVYKTFSLAGYTTLKFQTAEQFYETVKENPPHTILLEQDMLIVLGDTFIEEVIELLPEVHIIIYADQHELFSTSHLIRRGVYDCVAYHEDNLDFLVRAVDRASECDYYIYMNEQLKNRSLRNEGFSGKNEMPFFDIWISQLHEKRNLKEVIDSFLTETSRHLSKKEIIYFKYIPSHQSLVASQSIVTNIDKVRGLGIELTREEKRFSIDILKTPMKLQSLKKLLKSALNVNQYVAFPLIVNGIPEGIFVILNIDINLQGDTYIKSCVKALALKVGQINLIKKLHTVSIHDDKTRVLNREYFLDTLKNEIARSRRLTLPVTLVLISLDQTEEVQSQLNQYEQDMLLKMCATILRRHSRVNDIIGRLDKFNFGLILPHTGKLGGAIKAERMRRIFESADFSKVISGHKSITVSVGVSEYPSHSKSYEDILKTADEAVDEVKKGGSNKVCLASAPAGFIPDFVLDGSKL